MFGWRRSIGIKDMCITFLEGIWTRSSGNDDLGYRLTHAELRGRIDQSRRIRKRTSARGWRGWRERTDGGGALHSKLMTTTLLPAHFLLLFPFPFPFPSPSPPPDLAPSPPPAASPSTPTRAAVPQATSPAAGQMKEYSPNSRGASKARAHCIAALGARGQGRHRRRRPGRA